MTTYNRKQIMQDAWSIARDAVVKFGGKAREYLSLALKEIWSTIKNGVKKIKSELPVVATADAVADTEEQVVFAYLWDVTGVSKAKLNVVRDDFKKFFAQKPKYDADKKQFAVTVTPAEKEKLLNPEFRVYGDQPEVRRFIKFINI